MLQFLVYVSSVPAAMAVPFGDGGAALQRVLDGIATDGANDVTAATDELADMSDTLWSVGGSGGAISTLVLELAGFAAGTNKFGVYDAADPNNMVELFDGAASAGDQVVMGILADGSVKLNFVDTGIDFAAGNKFGFYLDSRDSYGGGGGLFFSDTSLNIDGVDHMAAFQGIGEEIQLDSPDPNNPFAAGIWSANEFILAFEATDYDTGSDDGDFTDFVVLVESISPMPVPEPGTIALLGIGLAGLVGAGVRRRMKKDS